MAKEQKTNKALVKYQGRHNEATVALDKAKEQLAHKQTEHRNLIVNLSFLTPFHRPLAPVRDHRRIFR